LLCKVFWASVWILKWLWYFAGDCVESVSHFGWCISSFHHCNEIPNIINLHREKVYFGPWFSSGPIGLCLWQCSKSWWEFVVKQNCSSHQLRSKEEKEEGFGFPQSLQGNAPVTKNLLLALALEEILSPPSCSTALGTKSLTPGPLADIFPNRGK
jgi:hypothetical protein